MMDLYRPLTAAAILAFVTASDWLVLCGFPLDEGTLCARPTQTLALGNGLFELFPTADYYNSTDEHWEIAPGSVVRGAPSNRDGKPCLLAVALGSQ